MAEKKTGDIMPFGWISERKTSIVNYGSRSSYYKKLMSVMGGARSKDFTNSNVFIYKSKYLFYVSTSSSDTAKGTYTAYHTTFGKIAEMYDTNTDLSAFLVLIRNSKVFDVFKIDKDAAVRLGKMGTEDNRESFDPFFVANFKVVKDDRSIDRAHLDIVLEKEPSVGGNIDIYKEQLPEEQYNILKELEKAIGQLDGEKW